MSRMFTAKWGGRLWLNELLVSFLILVCSKTLIFRGIPFSVIAQLQVSNFQPVVHYRKGGITSCLTLALRSPALGLLEQACVSPTLVC